MINHARTLLLNQGGPHLPQAGVLGDVYIPAFRPVQDGPMSDLRQLLFDARAYDGLVYRTAQYMAVLHSTEYEQYLFDLDSRITYNPQASGLSAFRPGFSYTGPYRLVASQQPPWAGYLQTRWRVTVLDDGGVSGEPTLFIENNTTGESATVTPVFDTSSGVSSQIPLPGVVGSFLISTGAAGTPVVQLTDRWDITNAVLPDDRFVFIQDAVLNDPTRRRALFGDGEQEPYKSFYLMLIRGYILPHRVSGILLAFIYRMEELRTHGL
jgi:hypothetical protein